jgi:hypothetical protein
MNDYNSIRLQRTASLQKDVDAHKRTAGFSGEHFLERSTRDATMAVGKTYL